MHPGFGLMAAPVDAKSVQVIAAFRLLDNLHEEVCEANRYQRDDALKELGFVTGTTEKQRIAMTDVIEEAYKKSDRKIEKDFRDRERKILKKAAGPLARLAEGK